MVIGSGSLKRDCGDYFITIKAAVAPTPKADDQKKERPGFPTLTAGTACFSDTPQGQKAFHPARASAFAYVIGTFFQGDLYHSKFFDEC